MELEYATLISRILEAEQTAQQIAQEAKEKQNSLETEMVKEAEAVRADFYAKTDRRLEQMKLATEESKISQIEAQSARFAEAESKMEEAYRRYGDNWVDSLFRQAVGMKP